MPKPKREEARLKRWGLRLSAAYVVSVVAIAVLPPWWAVDLVANFRIQLAGVGSVLAIAAASWREARWAVASGLAALLAFAPIATQWWSDRGPAGEPNARFSVWSHNLHRERVSTQLLSAMAQERPSIVIFLEVTPVVVEQLAVVENYRCEVSPRDDAFGIGACVTDATASIKVLPINRELAIEVTVSIGGREVRVLGIHTWPPVTPEFHRRRGRLIEAAASWVLQGDGASIVVGDFNATPWSKSLDPLREAGLRSTTDGGFPHATWGPLFARIPIDLCFVSRDIAVESRTVLGAFGSDHNVQAQTLALRKGRLAGQQ